MDSKSTVPNNPTTTRAGYARITVTVEFCKAGSEDSRKFELDAWAWRRHRNIVEWILGKEIDTMIEALK